MATPDVKLNILISGSGIAGPALAFWLYHLVPGAIITVLERSPAPRYGGQAVDLRGASVRVAERMGLLQAIKDKNTTEIGMQFVHADGKTKATFPMTGNVEQQSMTSEYEIVRGDLAKIFMDDTAKLDRVKYLFDDMVTDLEELSTGKVRATFANRLPTTEYDLVVGADGMMSRTRRIVFGAGPDNGNYLRRLGQYSAYFTIPCIPEDTKFAQWYNAPGGRLIFLRPDAQNATRVYIAVTDGNLARFDEYDRLMREGTREEQMQWFEREFKDAGFQTERVLREMRKSSDFYTQQIAQVRMNQWVKGRVALLGDAGYCPSPISGVGAGSAIVGAYVLAGEISRSPLNIPHALLQYQERMRPYVKSVQRLIPGAPQCANPQTDWGLWAFNKVTGFLSNPIVEMWISFAGKFLPAFGGTGWPLPDYGRAEKKHQ